MQQEVQKNVDVYTAQQTKQHKQCYSLETNTSLKILKSIQNRSTVAKVCEDNLSNLNQVIDRKQVKIYVKEKQNNQGYLTSFLQSMLGRLRNPIQQEQESSINDSSGDWQPDDEEEEDDTFQQQ
ncbi:unnamed protein product [Paramecium sonneborni]|uniref:Uncharacterized protein n=1 Tax=Paramecium sonneborni TaxID=65129 RepID=A0A8S1LB63_9CILI|nr:unnamed protein product [Paramecium sonneborni]